MDSFSGQKESIRKEGLKKLISLSFFFVLYVKINYLILIDCLSQNGTLSRYIFEGK
jgi:peroxiredoxin